MPSSPTNRYRLERVESALVLFGLALFLSIASPHFLTQDNVLNIVAQSSINAVLGIGLTFVIISGGIDLSVGSVMALSGLFAASALSQGASVGLALLVAIGTGVVAGALNGAITTLTRIPPFITTLGMMLTARSLAKVFSNSAPIAGLPSEFVALASDFLHVPIAVWCVVALYIMAHVVLKQTTFGRYIYAVGGNEQAAWLSGVPIWRTRVAAYTLSGGLAGVAAVLMTSRLNAASPLAGEMYELYAIAAAVIGGVSLAGGEGGIWGTLLGALVMGMLRNGLNLLNVPSAWEGVVVGAVLVAAVVIDRRRHADGVVASRPPSRWRRRLQWAAITASLIVACAAAVALRERHHQANAGTRIAFIPKASGSPFWQSMLRAAEQEASRLGVHLVVLAADRETDVERQHDIVENVIEQNVSAIILAPSGSRELLPAIAKANAQGIPVLICDSKLDAKMASEQHVNTVTFIGSDNFRGGFLAGQAMGEKLMSQLEASETAEVGIIEGIPSHETVESRRLGFLEGLRAFPRVRVVASQTASSERERAFAVTQNMLQAHPHLDGIFAANDEMALGAIAALGQAHRAVLVAGYDATSEALQAIREGKMFGTVAQFPEEVGREAVKQAVDLVLHGQQLPPTTHTRIEFVRAEVASP